MLARGKFCGNRKCHLVKMSREPTTIDNKEAIYNLLVLINSLFVGEHVKLLGGKVIGYRIECLVSYKETV